eukprot:4364888-Prymnesium_polylepis.1
MSLRDRNGAGESPPFTPKAVPKSSAESIKKYQDIIAKRNNSRRGKGDKNFKAMTRIRASPPTARPAAWQPAPPISNHSSMGSG